MAGGIAQRHARNVVLLPTVMSSSVPASQLQSERTSVEIERASISKGQDERRESSAPSPTLQSGSLDYADPPPVHSDPFVTHRWRAWLQFAACSWTLFMAGWNDGSTGPLLPRIQEVYHVSLG